MTFDFRDCQPGCAFEHRSGEFYVSTIQLCDGRWETCVFRGEDLLEDQTEMTWDDPEAQHQAVCEKVDGWTPTI
jgi:hypothetical protein